MSNNDIRERLQKVFRDVFDDEEIILRDEMTADDIEDWDSLMHITLINDIEAEFNITFSTDEIIGAKNVGEFIRFIEAKL